MFFEWLFLLFIAVILFSVGGGMEDIASLHLIGRTIEVIGSMALIALFVVPIGRFIYFIYCLIMPYWRKEETSTDADQTI